MSSPGRPRREVRAREAFGQSVVAALAAKRQEAGISRKALAISSGVSSETIAKIEQGATTDPGFSIVAALADALNFRLDDLGRLAHSRSSPAREPPIDTSEPS